MTESDVVTKAAPIVKWAGGKRQLEEPILKIIDRLHPATILDYHEPFCGGAAIFFALRRRFRIERAHLSDSNADLINLYRQVQEAPQALLIALKALVKKGTSEKRYYEVRASMPRSPAGQAARMMYLNKAGYNGLYRVNLSGKFNSPWGKRKNPTIFDEEAIWAAHHALSIAEIRCESFEGAFGRVRKTGGFVYYDPPYWPTRPTANFTSYTAAGFNKENQITLSAHLAALAGRGIPALLSNSDVADVRKLYEHFNRTRVEARRNVNSNGAKRGKVGEWLVESSFKTGAVG